MQFYVIVFAEKFFQGSFLIQERNDRLPIPGGGLFLNNHQIPGQDAVIPHRLTLHFQRKGSAIAPHGGGYFHEFRLGDGLNGIPRGDKTRHGNTRKRGELLDGHFHSPRDLMCPAFVACDGHSGGVQLLGELFLGEAEGFPGLFEGFGVHVTNRYTIGTPVSTLGSGSKQAHHFSSWTTRALAVIGGEP